ncbi:unnamed protein product [Arctogadus glacialis]
MISSEEDVQSVFKRPSHDISLEEFDDEDLSEITDDCGIGLNYDSDPYEKGCCHGATHWITGRMQAHATGCIHWTVYLSLA